METILIFVTYILSNRDINKFLRGVYTMGKSSRRIAVLIIFITISSFLLYGCGSKQSSSGSSTGNIQNSSMQSANVGEKKSRDQRSVSGNQADSEKSASDTGKADAANSSSVVAAARAKVIKTANIQLETLKFEEASNAIIRKTNSLGGYVESSNITGKRIEESGLSQNRNAKLVLRVPKASFDKFILDMNNVGNVVSQNITGQDVTNQYFDTEAHLKALKTEEERLLELLSKTGSLNDTIQVEKELANVRYDIENLTGTLKKLDDQIDYSTINIDVLEVQTINSLKEKPVSLLSKVSSGFKTSVKLLIEIIKWIIIIIASVLPFAVVIVPLFFLGKFLYKK